eukprot:TRINITY_DN14225_c0_g4_i2.p1 TRINITY_DN14225_c0_g4~~TRINITY_DN14225_c0_g4_i2.p1  ORF type:complete len:730 (-),score=136.75 TRINITY_DN14225_c0_g4_i2:185-2374(-)
MTVLDDLREPGAGVGVFPPHFEEIDDDPEIPMPLPEPTYLDETESSNASSDRLRVSTVTIGNASLLDDRRVSQLSQRSPVGGPQADGIKQSIRSSLDQAFRFIKFPKRQSLLAKDPSASEELRQYAISREMSAISLSSVEENAAPTTARERCREVLKSIIYNLVSFFVLWFGPAMFDMDCDGDFDGKDVDHFLQATLGLNPPRRVSERRELRTLRGFLKEARRYNLLMSEAAGAGGVADSDELLTQPSQSTVDGNIISASAAEGASKSFRRSSRLGSTVLKRAPWLRIEDNVAVEALIKRCSVCAQQNDAAGAAHVVKEMLRKPAYTFTVARALVDPRLEGLFKLDIVDGDVDITDLLDAPLPGLIKEDVAKRMSHGQALPVFIVFQCTVCLLLWVSMSLAYPVQNSSKYGLDSLVPGCFDLRLYELSELEYSGCSLMILSGEHECKSLALQVWRWLLYQFTHMSFQHVFFNCVLTLVLGIPLEGLEGTTRIFMFFQVGVIGGAWCAFLTGLRYPIVGMSGGCYSMFGMHFADLVTNWNQKSFRFLTLAFLMTMAALDTGMHFWNTSQQKEAGPPVSSTMTHLGGVIAGTIVAICFGRNVVIHKWERVLMVCCFVIGVGMSVLCLYWAFAVFPPRPLFPSLTLHDPNEKPWCWARQVFDPRQLIGQSEFQCVRCSYPGCIRRFSPPAVKESYPVHILGCDTGGFGGKGLWNDQATAPYDCPGPAPCPLT